MECVLKDADFRDIYLSIPMKFLFVVVGLARLAGHEVRGSGREKRPSLSLPFALNSHGSFSPRPRCLSPHSKHQSSPNQL